MDDVDLIYFNNLIYFKIQLSCHVAKGIEAIALVGVNIVPPFLSWLLSWPETGKWNMLMQKV